MRSDGSVLQSLNPGVGHEHDAVGLPGLEPQQPGGGVGDDLKLKLAEAGQWQQCAARPRMMRGGLSSGRNSSRTLGPLNADFRAAGVVQSWF